MSRSTENGSNTVAHSRLQSVASHVIAGSSSRSESDEVRSDFAGAGKFGARSPFTLEDHPIDEIRKIKVAVIGAGLAGINAGILLPAKVPGIELKIYEKNSDVGGTWLENKYPGVRCDIPAHVYQSTFESNTQWTEEFASGAEIGAYWKRVALKFDVYKHLLFNRKIKSAEWIENEAKWLLRVEDVLNGNVTEDRVDILITAIGHFNAWKLPDYPGIQDYRGHIRHASNWDPNFDPTGKTIATIGNGASGIQVTTALQPLVRRLDHYARSPTWIAGSFAGDERTVEPKYYSEAQLKDFGDPSKYLEFRKNFESTYWKRFGVLFKNNPMNEKLKEDFKQLMAQRLSKKPELLKYIVPDFSPHCRRLTPGPGYLEAISEPNVEFIPTPIERFTAHGIQTVDGKIRDVDAVICATGANTDFAPPFSIKASGLDLKTAWKPTGEFGFPLTYLGACTPGFPNLFFINGPNASGFSGTIPHSVENQITYIARILRKISSQGISTIAPSEAATLEFVEYCDAFFPTTVLSEDCKSWSNGGVAGARIHGHWPGSAAHVNQVRREPRWEDFVYGYTNKRNRFAYFGNGWTKKEEVEGSDLTSYLKKHGTVDLREYHESWFDL